MVTIRDLLHDDLIIEEIQSTDKDGVIREFARLLATRGKIRDEQSLIRVLEEREVLGTTGIGNGIAIPHGKVPMHEEMIVAFGRSSQGVAYQAIDGEPVYLFFVLITPEDKPGDHLKTLARISRIIKNPELRERLRRAVGRDEIRTLICAEDAKYPQPLNQANR